MRKTNHPDVGHFTATALSTSVSDVISMTEQLAADASKDEAIHQLRVAIRRLRTLLRELPSLHRDREFVQEPLTRVFRALGELRDREYFLHTIQPLVQAAGGAPLSLPHGFHDAGDPSRLANDLGLHDALTFLLLRSEQLRDDERRGTRRMLKRRLGRLHDRMVSAARDFMHLSERKQHAARKRVKRLRYLAEFAAPLFGRGRIDDYLRHVKPAQEQLGLFNDHATALALYEELARTDPRAQFGADWLRSRRHAEAKACRKALLRAAKARPFWVD